MEFFRIHKTIPFMRYSHILNSVSIVSFLFAVYWIFTHGLAFSIEFTGGTQVVVNYPEAVSAEDDSGRSGGGRCRAELRHGARPDDSTSDEGR